MQLPYKFLIYLIILLKIKYIIYIVQSVNKISYDFNISNILKMLVINVI